MNAQAVATACPVCEASGTAPLYAGRHTASISSNATLIAVPTSVYCCRTCAHLYTPPLPELERYYDTGYNVRLEAEAADDLYELRDGIPYYRAEHQAAVALRKLNLPPAARVLDFGSGKARTLRAMLGARPDLRPFVFDVSANYAPSWADFVPAAQQASYVVPDAWSGTFDAVLSFFALEHVRSPRDFLATVRALLAPNGVLHAIVPNVRRNVGDFIVVDHVNHFMPSSIRYAFATAGFTDIRIDESAHTAAYVIDARRAGAPRPAGAEPELATYLAEAETYARTWHSAGEQLASFERERARGRRAAIYGSGFYGVFIAAALHDRSNVAYFLDQNPHQQAKRIFDLPVLPPERLGDDVEVVYAGLNPARARAILAGVPALHRASRDIFVLELP